MRKNIAAGNWKMHTTVEEGIELYKALDQHETDENTLVITGVPATHLQALKDLKGNVSLAAQNCHQELAGAFTGEISAATLSSMHIPYVILGHSERRQYFNEDDDLILHKIKTALSQGLKVIYCCGEPLETRKIGNQDAYVQLQLQNSIFQLSEGELEEIIIAYEPVWAIGTGETATPEQAQEMHYYIRSMIAHSFSKNAADQMHILYGGSVKPANAEEIFAMPDVDGGLVGGASLDAESFKKIIDSFS